METLDSHTRHSCRLHFLNMLELLDCLAAFQPLPPVGRLYHIAVFPRQRVSRGGTENVIICDHSVLQGGPTYLYLLYLYLLWQLLHYEADGTVFIFFSPALNSSFLTSSCYWQWYWYWYYASQVHMWRVNFPEPKQSTRQRTGQSLFGDNLPFQRWQQVERFWTWMCWDLLLFVSVGETSLSAAARDRINGGWNQSNSFLCHMTKNLRLWAAWCVTTTWIPKRGCLGREPVSSRLMLA